MWGKGVKLTKKGPTKLKAIRNTQMKSKKNRPLSLPKVLIFTTIEVPSGNQYITSQVYKWAVFKYVDQYLDPHPLKLIKIMIIWNQGLKKYRYGFKKCRYDFELKVRKITVFSSGSRSAFGSAKKNVDPDPGVQKCGSGWIQIRPYNPFTLHCLGSTLNKCDKNMLPFCKIPFRAFRVLV